MGAGIVLAGVLVLLALAYLFYGRWLAHAMGVDEYRRTPVARRAGARAGAGWGAILSTQAVSIVGLAPLQATLASMLFGFVPALLWILVSGLWFGCAQQLAILLATIRSGGRGLGSLLDKLLDGRGRYVLMFVSWILMLMMFAMLVDVTSRSLGAVPMEVQAKDYLLDQEAYRAASGAVQAAYQAASAGEAEVANAVPEANLNINIFDYVDTVRYEAAQKNAADIAVGNGRASLCLLVVLLLAPFLGHLLYGKELRGWLAMLLCAVACALLIIMVGSAGLTLPGSFTLLGLTIQLRDLWRYVLAAYIFLCAALPLKWNSLPRDMLAAGVSAAVMALIILGIFLKNPVMELPAVRGWRVENSSMLPVLFGTMACGAVAGAHGLIQTQGAAQLLENEKHAKIITVGGMVIAVLVGTVVLVVGASVWIPQAPSVTSFVYSQWTLTGLVQMVASLGISVSWSQLLVQLMLALCAVAAMDTALRIARSMFQWLFGENRGSVMARVLSTRWVAALITGVAGLLLSLEGYKSMWGMVAPTSLVMAAVTLWIGAVWLWSNRRRCWMVEIPAIVITGIALWVIAGLLWPIFSVLTSGAITLREGVHGGILVLLAILLCYMVASALYAMKMRDRAPAKIKTT